MTQPASLLRRYVQPLPQELGVNGQWSWSPAVPVQNMLLGETSPTQEYSSIEGNEHSSDESC